MRDFASLHAQPWVMRTTARAGLAMVFAAVLAFLAPFGTYRLGPVERVGYWTVLMGAWLVLSLGAAAIMDRLPPFRSRSAALRRVLAVVLATVPMMLVTGIANTLLTDWRADASELVELAISIALIGGIYVGLADGMTTHAGSGTAVPDRSPAEGAGDAGRPAEPVRGSAEGPSPGELPTDTALIARLPAHLRADILCLQVEDHYVRVHARAGSAMVLMRFSDALRGVDHLPGAQVHRSWWVAEAAVTGVRRTGRTAQLTLSNGSVVPVSQPYMAHALRTWGALEASVA